MKWERKGMKGLLGNKLTTVERQKEDKKKIE